MIEKEEDDEGSEEEDSQGIEYPFQEEQPPPEVRIGSESTIRRSNQWSPERPSYEIDAPSSLSPPQPSQQELSSSAYSRATTQDPTLKAPKHALKQFLRHNAGVNFISRLRCGYEMGQVNVICDRFYSQNCIKRAFQGWGEAIETIRFEEEMEEYYEEAAEQQEGDDGAAILHHSTNLVYKSFRALLLHRKAVKVERTLHSLLLKLTWMKLLAHTRMLRRQSKVVRRIGEYREQRLRFKAFNILKNHFIRSSGHSNMVRAFTMRRQMEMQAHCFSILLYEFKLGRLQLGKAVKHHRRQLKGRVFQRLLLLW